jgi:hypothetical protein
MTVRETPDGRWEVIADNGDPVDDFATQSEALDYVERKGKRRRPQRGE